MIKDVADGLDRGATSVVGGSCRIERGVTEFMAHDVTYGVQGTGLYGYRLIVVVVTGIVEVAWR